MKKLAVSDQSACMACLACENACSEAFYKKMDNTLSCVSIIMKNDKVKTNVCSQCGVCAKACEAGAITQNAKGVYMIDKKKCVNCGKCIEACPFDVIVRAEGAAAPSKCIACGICAKACPMNILYIKED